MPITHNVSIDPQAPHLIRFFIESLSFLNWVNKEDFHQWGFFDAQDVLVQTWRLTSRT